MNITIQRLTLEHIAQIEDSFQQDFDRFWNVNVLKTEIQNPASLYIAALNSKYEVVGFAGIWQPLDEAHITNIVTKTTERNQGIAKKMLKELIKIAKDQNAKDITLEVNVNNNIAIILYQEFQFKKVGLRKKYYNNVDDAIIMTLPLMKKEEKENTNEEGE